MLTSRINDIFYSYQGEGPYHGKPQIFIRFSGCNLNCVYCDTRHATYRIYNVADLLKKIAVYLPEFKGVLNIALTGGEPLCQAGFLTELLPALKKEKCEIYLETNGVLYKKLKGLLSYIDIIAMDLKLPSSTGRQNFWEEHEKFLKIAAEKNTFVKAVVTNKTKTEDIKTAAELVSGVSRDIFFVIQPITPLGDCRQPSAKKIAVFTEIARQKLSRVKVIPQMHKIVGIK